VQPVPAYQLLGARRRVGGSILLSRHRQLLIRLLLHRTHLLLDWGPAPCSIS
jgi:hypothetical protein